MLETYSAGMKQRLKLAQALVHDPKLLFLDEPTSNLDPQGRVEILDLIKDISSKKDIHVLISSHILTDIEATCSAVVILNKGLVAAEGELATLRQIDFSLYELRIKGESAAYLQALRDASCRVEETEDQVLKVYLPAGFDRRELFRIAGRLGVQVRHFVKSQTSLEDLFARTVGVD
jgi:ABC-2 type transport system ATP-binding protein